MALLRPIALIVAILYLFAFADALPSKQNHHLRVSACSKNLNKFGLKTAKRFCIAYLNGRKPASPSKVIVETNTVTLDPKTTTIPVFTTLTNEATVSQTTTSSLTTLTSTTKLVTATVTPTETESVTATETVTTTVTDLGGDQRRRRATNIDAAYLDPRFLINEDKRSASAFTTLIESLDNFLSSEISEACLLLVYGRTSDATKTLTSSFTTTSTPTQKTTEVTNTITTTKTETDVSTETETLYSSTSTETITTTEQAPVDSITVTVATTTQTITTTIQPSPKSSTGVIKVDFDSGAPSKYLIANYDNYFVNSYVFYFTSDINSASKIIFDNSKHLLLLASDTSYRSYTFGSPTKDNYYFRLGRDGAYTPQALVTCSLEPSTKQLTCSTAEGYSVFQSCTNELVIGRTNYCIQGSVKLTLI